MKDRSWEGDRLKGVCTACRMGLSKYFRVIYLPYGRCRYIISTCADCSKCINYFISLNFWVFLDYCIFLMSYSFVQYSQKY